MKNKIILAVFFNLIFSSGIFVKPVQAQTKAWTTGVCVEEMDGAQVATIQGLECLLANVLSVAITGIGLVGFLMFVYAAFKYLLAGTNSKNVEDARKAMTYSIIGLIVALSAFFIVNLISQFTGIEALLLFRIPSSETVW